MSEHKKAFSLMELMIVIAIIGILAAFSIPSYHRYLAKAKQTEVALNLASLHAAQQLYFLEHSTYSNDLSALGWEPSGHKNNMTQYSYGFQGQKNNNYFVGAGKIESNSFPTTHANKDSFIACAIGDLQGKGKLDIWTIDESKTIKHISDGL